jgi:hypothetical protein
MQKALPNPAHIAINQLATQVNSLRLITQNVDDLHEQAGSPSVIHLHGAMMRSRFFGCGRDYVGPFQAPDIVAEWLMVWVDRDMPWHGTLHGKRGLPPTFSDTAIQFRCTICGVGSKLFA